MVSEQDVDFTWTWPRSPPRSTPRWRWARSAGGSRWPRRACRTCRPWRAARRTTSTWSSSGGTRGRAPSSPARWPRCPPGSARTASRRTSCGQGRRTSVFYNEANCYSLGCIDNLYNQYIGVKLIAALYKY